MGVRPSSGEGPLVGVHAGLEDVDDLIVDFAGALERAAKT